MHSETDRPSPDQASPESPQAPQSKRAPQGAGRRANDAEAEDASSGPSSRATDEAPPRTYRSLTYRLIMGLVHTFTLFPFPTKVLHRDRLPQGQGALIVCNHASFLDIPFVAKGGTGRHVCFVARQSLANSRLLGFIMRSCGAVLIDPKSGDRKALKQVVDHLKAGDLVTMFAEGTRSRDGRLLPFKRGALLAARQAKVPVVPCAVVGSHKAWGRGKRLPKPARVQVIFGEPRPVAGAATLDEVRDWIESQLAGTDQAALPQASEGPSGSQTGQGS